MYFFDDILIYSASWTEHLQHLPAVFSVLHDNQLHVKHSKCAFATSSVAYLSHVISAMGVAMDDDKVVIVATWSQPASARALRAFLGLAWYYRRFIKDYGTVAAPLTRLLRKEGFHWDHNATAAFWTLKVALSSTPVLHLSNFGKPFVVDCDAFGTGFDAALHQGAGPVAFFSKPFATRHLKIAAYERELIAHSGGALLVVVPLGPPLRPHRSIRPQVHARSVSLHRAATSMD